MLSEEEDDASRFTSFLSALDKTRNHAIDPEAPIVLSDDAERFLPNRLARFLAFLDDAIEASIEFVSPDDFILTPIGQDLGYVPAGTMEGGEDMWAAALDDIWFRHHLDRLTERVEARLDLLNPTNQEERALVQRLLRIQDSSFYFWHYVSRTRASFCVDLLTIERWLDGKPKLKEA